MKKFVLGFFLILGIAFSTNAQMYNDAWVLGVGLNSARLMSDINAEQLDFGAGISLRRDINERTGFRATLNYNHFTTTTNNTNNPFGLTVDHISFGFDYQFRFFIGEIVTPYLGAGFSIQYFDVQNALVALRNGGKFGELGADIMVGAIVDVLGPDWKLFGELQNTTISSDRFDGTEGANGGIFGGWLDSYIKGSVGVQYYLSKGEPYKGSDLPGGVDVDYTKIDDIAKKYAAGDNSKLEAKVDQLTERIASLEKKSDGKDAKTLQEIKDALRASGKGFAVEDLKPIYFKKNTANMELESYQSLVHAANVLNSLGGEYEIAGYTDNTGSAEYNKSLSVQRAEFVKNYLVSRGVDAAKLTVKGYGQESPASDNSTDDGKKMNRRVVISKIK